MNKIQDSRYTLLLPSEVMDHTPLILTPDCSFIFDFVPKEFPAIFIGLEPDNRNDAYTPWPVPDTTLKGCSFKGKAKEFLNEVITTMIPSVRKKLGNQGKMGILGISLGALFGVYATTECPLFSFCASISGSFWYPRFTAYLASVKKPSTSYYFCCGEDEGKGRKDILKESREATLFIANSLGSKVQFDNKGHLSYHKERIGQALEWVQSQL